MAAMNFFMNPSRTMMAYIIDNRTLENMMLKTYEGGCHCGTVRFRVRADMNEVLDCNCSVCTKKGFLHLIVPLDQFEILQGADALSRYQFNTGTAQHMFCARCGMHPFYVPRSDPDKMDVNARCIDNIDVSALRPKAFDGRGDWDAANAAYHSNCLPS
jgi:hypothetical protein